MNLHIVLPAAAALAILAAAPASAQVLGAWPGYAPRAYTVQGQTGEAFVPSCQRFHNAAARARCKQQVLTGYYEDNEGYYNSY